MIGPSPHHRWKALAAVVCLCAAAAAQTPRDPLIIDTDAGPDDLMAIAFLLARPDVRIEAITVVEGLAHGEAGARNLLRLLEMVDRTNIGVHVGRPAAGEGGAAFPDAWRKQADELPGVDFPATALRPEPVNAVDYLIQRFGDRRRPVRVLALGPLSNIAAAIQRNTGNARTISELVVMGGAIDVPGNATTGTGEAVAEWNFRLDPLAARTVLGSQIRPMLVSLDATNQVPIDRNMRIQIQTRARTRLAEFVAELLGLVRDDIENQRYFAWDPLAAAVMVDPYLIRWEDRAVDVEVTGPAAGQTRVTTGRPPNARVPGRVNAQSFRRLFLDTLTSPLQFD